MMLPPDLLESITRYCAYRDRSIKEVREKLLALGANSAQAEAAIELLKAEAYLDERRFALSFASGKFRIRKWGKKQIAMHLRQKGIAEPLIGEALESLNESSYRDTVKEMVLKKWKVVKGTPVEKKGKVFRFLLSKGYESGLILEAIAEAEKVSDY